MIPFFTLWAGFACIWNGAVWGSGAPLTFKLFGIPFLIIDDPSQVRWVELSTVLHETRTRRHGAAITVQFRPPSEPPIGRFGLTIDSRLTGLPQGDTRTFGSAPFFFCDVNDAQALLVALGDAPSAK